METKHTCLLTPPDLHNHAYSAGVSSAPHRWSLNASTLLCAPRSLPRLCLVVDFSKWSGQQQTGGQGLPCWCAG